ncbi:MAG: hypothetical protein UY21_C0011G0038 [Microgenomates group bacterium GW2011_GWA1_48_10]|uniref:Uncharacterized protein n=1 Tax=Candidatus Gottesmanbacteria bacterium RIFCSPHIGHO2_01_FULL_47_48 TaxID=1798381 RepID=A0A1F6A4X6_9BACT|nr:MAG: hypothetical protein UY21_C0011G0038 [Microgenomates group bacterium GW2011_GWA1_48_10]OGG19741.1 MAG: hypothetical protein A2721_01145 [Candidatus Gottesmanbacteria bacterium RIFCSPHIGHO2_01_FULL_47_48]
MKKSQFSNLQSQIRGGFTFIETILYVAIVTIMLSALIPFAWNIIESGTKSSVQQELSSNARFISEKIKSEIRQANGITSVNGSSLSLTGPGGTTDFNLVGGKIRINKPGGGPVALNSDDTQATTLNFTDYSSADGKTKHIQYRFTLEDNYNSTRSEFQGSVTIEGSAEIRSN